MPTMPEIHTAAPAPEEAGSRLVILATPAPEAACIACYRMLSTTDADMINEEVLAVRDMIAEGCFDNGRCACLTYA